MVMSSEALIWSDRNLKVRAFNRRKNERLRTSHSKVNKGHEVVSRQQLSHAKIFRLYFNIWGQKIHRQIHVIFFRPVWKFRPVWRLFRPVWKFARGVEIVLPPLRISTGIEPSSRAESIPHLVYPLCPPPRGYDSPFRKQFANFPTSILLRFDFFWCHVTPIIVLQGGHYHGFVRNVMRFNEAPSTAARQVAVS